MSAPHLRACYFDQPGADSRWRRLAAVLERSAREQCPGWDLDIVRLPRVPRVDGGSRQWGFESNTRKLEQWSGWVDAAADGARVLLVDADMLVLRPLDPVWDDETFDVAYSVRPAGARYPLNGGVVAVRVGPAARAFFRAWVAENARMFADRRYHDRWRAQFGGINQAALGALLECLDTDVRVATLPCLEWNCEDACWPAFDPAVTRILHIKSDLRQACLFPGPHRGRWPELVSRWRAVDQALLKASA